MYRDETKKSKYVYWICECKCGKLVSVSGRSLKSGDTTSCGCKNLENIQRKQRNAKDITDNIYGSLTAKHYIKSGKRGAIWLCECKCGNTCEAYVTDLSSKNKTSCGCIEKQRQIENGNKMIQLITNDTNVGIISKTKPNKIKTQHQELEV